MDTQPRPDIDALAVSNAAETMRLLADPTRLHILALLTDQELSVTTLAGRLNRPLPGISQHLSKLRAGHLVTTRKDGTTVLYSLSNEHVATLVSNVLEHSEHVLYEIPPHHRQ